MHASAVPNILSYIQVQYPTYCYTYKHSTQHSNSCIQAQYPTYCHTQKCSTQHSCSCIQVQYPTLRGCIEVQHPTYCHTYKRSTQHSSSCTLILGTVAVLSCLFFPHSKCLQPHQAKSLQPHKDNSSGIRHVNHKTTSDNSDRILWMFR